ncbi:DUF4395 domain-containing protein [Fluviicola taffensis]|uniref:CDP-alcohol phosphatidyltransferase n=1 Tax=Fluviicola taffensis (strain DSM 16823 / NCIMB 13979 / RW262) TaxID=755732 RepID=F2IIZ8_FLUTR|nr:DUF4395 domain-containing protein [Fluviicola taffensis]AEA43856.1 CDP-alcohol phosphatidyltransferase [Fluviicola taffensis DSM 16823]
MMKEEVGISCPINDKQVNEIVIRTIAMQVIFIGSAALFFQNPIIAVLLAIDFGLRAFGFGQWSALRYSAQKLVTHFKLGYKATNEAPKKFAATIGFVVMSIFSILLFLKLSVLATIIGGLLLLFATLEGGFGICVGCILYQQLTRFRLV